VNLTLASSEYILSQDLDTVSVISSTCCVYLYNTLYHRPFYDFTLVTPFSILFVLSLTRFYQQLPPYYRCFHPIAVFTCLHLEGTEDVDFLDSNRH